MNSKTLKALVLAAAMTGLMTGTSFAASAGATAAHAKAKHSCKSHKMAKAHCKGHKKMKAKASCVGKGGCSAKKMAMMHKKAK